VSIDELGRAAAADVRRQASIDVDPSAALVDLHRTHRRRTALVVAAAAVVVAVVAGLVARGPWLGQAAQRTPVPAGAPSPSPSAVLCPPGQVCHVPGTRTFSVGLAIPLTLTLPADFSASFGDMRRDTVEFYRTSVSDTGVTVMENPVPARDDYTWTRDPAAGTDARSVAQWLAGRPFLAGTALSPTTVGGRPAWRVTGGLRRGAALTAHKNMLPAAPTFASGGGTAAYWAGLHAEYTLLDAPGGGLVVIWSWTLDHPASELAANRALVAGLVFH